MLDAETGFWYFGYRFFDSRCAQWLSHDPIREEGGFNLVAFCGGDPVNAVDPLGLEPQYGVLLGIRLGWNSRIDEFKFTDLSLIATLQDELSENLSLRGDVGYRLYSLGLGTSRDLQERFSDFWISGSIVHGKGEGSKTKVLTGGPLHFSALDDPYKDSLTWGQTLNWHSHMGYTRIGHIQIKGDNQYLHYQNDVILPPTFGGDTDQAWTASLTLGGVSEDDVSWAVGWAAFTGLPNLDANRNPRTTGSGTGPRGAHHDQLPFQQAFNRSIWYSGIGKGVIALTYHEPVKPYSSLWNLQNLVHDWIARGTPRFHFSNDDYYQIDLSINLGLGNQ